MGEVVQAPVAKITVPQDRLRAERDFTPLAESMAKIGLLHPITVTESGVLVSGRHRLEAAKSLGWKTIPAFVVEDDELKNRLLEIDENLKRLDLTTYEQAKHAEERERVLAALGQRAKRGAQAGNKNASKNEPATVAGSFPTTADIAKEAGMSERTWQGRVKIGRSLGEKTRSVLDMADPTDEKHRQFLNSTTQLNHLADISNKRGDEVAAEVAERVLSGEEKTTFDAYERMKRETAARRREAEREEKRRALRDMPLPARRYELIYADPPWRYEHARTDSRRIENHYPTMSLQEIKDLKVPAAEDATLFLWATSPKLDQSLEVMRAWGFEYRTSLVWVKDKIGMGYYARQRHELLLVGKRGNPPVPEPHNRPDSVIESPRLEHSAKPEVVYELLERMYPHATKVELFCRRPREGWDAWGNEIEDGSAA
ncbi:MT-A70 family methyltransferase [Rubrobacter calidifluminis]|uniref:MT-A70 family methyltransferase n=1 Tax=Rubrobacter calidifluminis TaxID=1392640 RepID=UPI002360EB98|nr:MT-A70 family methyltransferase [Rubrobacter calidifluminis]